MNNIVLYISLISDNDRDKMKKSIIKGYTPSTKELEKIKMISKEFFINRDIITFLDKDYVQPDPNIVTFVLYKDGVFDKLKELWLS